MMVVKMFFLFMCTYGYSVCKLHGRVFSVRIAIVTMMKTSPSVLLA